MPWAVWLILVLTMMFCFVVFRGAPYVPTKKRPLQDAFDRLYKISSKDLLVDIGSGDGLVLRAAAARGARAVGYELNPILVFLSRLLSRNPLISIRFADYWKASFPVETTVIYTFGDSRDIQKMYKKAEQTAGQLKKDLYFMSFAFSVTGKKHVKYDGHFYLYKIRYLHLDKA